MSRYCRASDCRQQL